MTAYQSIIQTGDLFDIMESEGGAPFYNTMQILHDEEHETNSPDRLSFFQDLIKNEARTAEVDNHILAPWLIVYIWQKTSLPNYTREAWRSLMQLDIDDGLIIEAAIDLLQHHPHGALRAEILQWNDSWQPQQDDETVIALSGKLAFEDPHPEVRINAIQHYWHEGSDVVSSISQPSWNQRLLDAMRSDPSPEVRSAIIRELSYAGSDVVEPQALFDLLREALEQEQNECVALQLLSALISRGRLKRQLETTIITLNYVKVAQTPRFSKEFQAVLSRLPNYHAAWLDASPFKDSGAFRNYLEAHFRPGTAALDERISNYRTLMQTTRPPIPNDQDLMDLFFDPDQTPESMGHLLYDLGDVGFKKLFATLSSPVASAQTRVELFEKMVGVLLTHDANGNLLRAIEPMKYLLTYGIKVALKTPPDAAELWTIIYRTIAEGAEDWTWALSELKWNNDQVDLDPLVDLVETARLVSTARGATELVVDLFERSPSEEGAIALANAWTSFAARTDLEDYLVSSLVYHMPRRSAFESYSNTLETIDRAMRIAQIQFSSEQSSYSTIDVWLKPTTQ